VSVDDETLMAFADGELSAPAQAAVAAAVAADPRLAARLERFRTVRGLLSGAVRASAPSPPAGLMAAARAAVANRGAGSGRSWAPALALAAGVAGLAIGLGAGQFGRDAAFVDFRGGMTAQGLLEAALDGAPSGVAATRSGATVAPLYTVVAADGRPCRAFRATWPGGAYEGAACREDRAWRLLALAAGPASAAGFAQASGVEPAAVAAALDALDPGDPLDEAAEQALIDGGWSAPGE